ncbi:glycosyltransferase [Halorubrum ezzemoulense]|uniref:glycosyltransferase n=1 Tax=Halorubrum ezzemoulense TaxID=337243 RepID=UPI00232B0CD5|nr:glycosyltransferase [Halorubrum ezzemoulense]MDB2262072.1 glycosyltransferase [Halorubrum ezzemoulense]MDB2268919.1 glycosyltransferase [Halorubrum ezzemoulense]
MSSSREVILFTPTLNAAGGIERNTVNLANTLSSYADIVVLTPKDEASGPLTSDLSSDIRVDELASPMRAGLGVLATVPGLIQYFNSNQPDAIISGLRHANLAVQIALKTVSKDIPLILTFHNDANRLTQDRDRFRRYRSRAIFKSVSMLRGDNERWVGVSKGVSNSIVDLTGIPPESITTIYNPVVTKKLLNSSFDPPEHPWLTPESEIPVVLGAKPQPQKNLTLLLKAVARSDREFRVIIVGQGNQTEELEQKAREIGIQDNVDIIGLVDEIYPYLYHTDIFALTSSWEGLSNILIEAMACGTQVVATDCPSGPSEILQDGEIGYLVDEGNSRAVTEGLERTIDEPYDSNTLRDRAQDFTDVTSAEEYLNLIG